MSSKRTTNGGKISGQDSEPTQQASTNETTRLIPASTTHRTHVGAEKNRSGRPTVGQFFFPPTNPTIQAYYRFTVTPQTPCAALHTRPLDGPMSLQHNRDSSGNIGNGNGSRPNSPSTNEAASTVSGLLRRSAVLPSHGTDPSGDWILVSVGARSGWARRAHFDRVDGDGTDAVANATRRGYGSHNSDLGYSPTGVKFTKATTFRAKEGWMGNQVFLLDGKLMFGSDAPLFFFTNFLIGGCL